MARFQLIEHGWPFSQYLVPVGTVLDTADWTWNGIPLPERFPLNVQCLDDDAVHRWMEFYGPNFRHRFNGVPGIVRPGPPYER